MEAIGHAGTCLGILASDGIVLAAEKRNINKLLDDVFVSDKIYKLHEYVWNFEKFEFDLIVLYFFIVIWLVVSLA